MVRGWCALCTATVSTFVGACVGDGPAPTASLGVSVAPLTLSGVTEACYDLRVTNAPAGAGETVWSRSEICSSRYGDGGGAVSFVGTCDASTGVDNTVELALVRLEDAGGSIDYANPCPPSAPCRRAAPCIEGGDSSVTFELTIARPARQGFFDVAINFDDLFCSAKVDCAADATAGGGPLELLFAPGGSARIPSVVLAFACTAGLGADTQLYFGDLAVDCGGTPVSLAITGPPGNLYSVASPAPQPLLQVATFRGAELLEDGAGTSWKKLYFNTALALDFDNLPGPCDLVGQMTAADGAFDVPFTTPSNVAYPLIEVNVPLVTGSGDTGYACTHHPLGSEPSDGVWVHYSPIAGAVTFDHQAFSSATSLAVADLDPLTLSPATLVLEVDQSQVFSASGGSPPYTFDVAAGGGAFSGSTYAAPSAQGTATVRVTDAVGRVATTGVTIEDRSMIVFVTSVTYDGQLGSLSGADSKCQALANAQPALAGRTFKAWLSSSTVNAAARLTHASTRYVRVDGVTVASDWGDLVDGTLAAPINVDEAGVTRASRFVWTNTSPNGTRSVVNYNATCNDWTSRSSTGCFSPFTIYALGNAGVSSDTGCQWTDRAADGGCGTLNSYKCCSNLFALYCLQQ